MTSCCLETKCIQCCIKTNMVLTTQDIKTIEKLGYEPQTFVTQRNGWLQLRNHKGRCVFHNGTICTIYEHRPEGCVLYPIVFDKDDRCAIYDSQCPQKQCFSLSRAKEQQLHSLIQHLEAERTDRILKKTRNPGK
jgi:uncharacterized protein